MEHNSRLRSSHCCSKTCSMKIQRLQKMSEFLHQIPVFRFWLLVCKFDEVFDWHSHVIFNFCSIFAAWARKCYQCDSLQNPGCADANQISQLYTDCANPSYGGAGGGFQGGIGQQGGIGVGINQQPFGNQLGNPQALGQQGYGGVGSGYGGDRCVKYTIVNPQQYPQRKSLYSLNNLSVF